MVTIAVCDGIELERQITAKYCRKYFEIKKEKYQLYEYQSGEDFLERDMVDILLVEINMKQISGILLKDLLQIMRAKTRIIFVTRDTEFMKDAFGKNVFAFLEKPLEYNYFHKMMDLTLEDVLESRNYIYCKEIVDYEKVYRKIYLKDVIFVEAQGYKTLIYTESGKCCVKSDKRISEWNKDYINQGFASCHRSYVVNLFHVVKMEADVELTGGIHVPLSREKREEFRQRYIEYKTLAKPSAMIETE